MMTVDREMEIIIEFPLEVVVDNLVRVRQENPDNVGRLAKMMLEGELKEKGAVDAGLSAMENPGPSVPRICAK
jgi:hypothetical protein